MGDYHRAEEYLYFNRLAKIRSANTREVLGCLGCWWLRPSPESPESQEEEVRPRPNLAELAKCTGLKPGSVEHIMKRLTVAEVTERHAEDFSSSDKRQKVFYSPALTEVGKVFLGMLSVPETCDSPTRPDQ